jgi:C4-dicarboxylate transporter DctM subunit
MTPAILATAVTILLLFLLVLRVPVAFSLLIAGLLGLVGLRSFDYAVGVSAAKMLESTGKYSLVIIPLFIAMGSFAKNGTLAADGFAMSRKVMERIPGGLAMSTILTCGGFAAICGSSVATVATVGPISISEMKKYGYSPSVAAGVVAAAGTLGVLIPPSIFLVLYAIVAGESVGAMLVAGFIPGIITMVAFMASIYLRAKISPSSVGATAPAKFQVARARGAGVSGAASSRFHGADPPTSVDAPTNLRMAMTAVRVLTLFAVVIGGIYLGIVTAIEAAALGMLLTIVFFALDHLHALQEGSVWSNFRTAIHEAMQLTAMVFALIIGAGVFTFFLVLARVPQGIAEWVGALQVPPSVVVILLLAALIPMGMFLDSFSILLIAVPLMHPIVTGLGFEGIWFGILVVKLIELGMITPPFGINAFVAAGVGKVSVHETFRGLLWFVPVEFGVVAVLFVFPELITWLPGTLS